MDEDQKPVVLEYFDFGNASDIKSLNEDRQKKNNFSNSFKEKNDCPLKSGCKRVSFSNRSSIRYYNEDANSSYSSEIFDKMIYSSEEPCTESVDKQLHCVSSDTESKDLAIAMENKQFPPLKKELVILLEKLPGDLMEQDKNENWVNGNGSQNQKYLFDSQNFNVIPNSLSNESEVSKLTESTEYILPEVNHELKIYSSPSKTDSSGQNISLSQELKVSIQRLPDNLLELHLNNNNYPNSELNINNSKQANSNEDQEKNMEVNTSDVKRAFQNSMKILKFSDNEMFFESEKSKHEAKSSIIKSASYLNQTKNSMTMDIVDFSLHNVREIIPVDSQSLCPAINTVSQCDFSLANNKLRPETRVNLKCSDLPLQQPALDGDVDSSCSTPSELLQQKPYQHLNSVNNCDVSIKNPYVLLERLHLVVPKIDDIQSIVKSETIKVSEKNVFCDELDARNDNTMQTECNIMLDNSCKLITVSNKLLKTAKGMKRPAAIKSVNAKKNRKCLSRSQKKSIKESKSNLQIVNEIFMPEDNIHHPLPEITEIIPVDSQNLISATNVVKQCNMSLNGNKFVIKTEVDSKHNDSSLLQLAVNPSHLETLTNDSDLQISEMFSPTENQNTISNNSPTEDDINSLLLSNLDNVEQPNALSVCPLSVCLKNSSNIEQTSTISDTSSISDIDILETYSSTENRSFISNCSLSEDDVPLSHLSKRINVKQSKVSTCLRKGIKRSQKNNTSRIKNFTDFNAMHMAEMAPPNSLTFKSGFKKKLENNSKTIKRKKTSSQKKILLPHLKKADPLALVAQMKKNCKESGLKKTKKSKKRKAKKHKNEIFLLSQPTKINCSKKSTLASNQEQSSNCKNNSTLYLKAIGDHCYFKSVESDIGNVSPHLQKVTLDSYNLSCNLYKIKKLNENPFKKLNSMTASILTKKSRKKKETKEDCHCKIEEKVDSNKLLIYLKTYLDNFFTDFDKLGRGKKKAEIKHDKEITKRRENITKMLIREMHNHLKNTCSIKKSFKNYKKRKLNKMNAVQISNINIELEGTTLLNSSKSVQSEENSKRLQKRGKNKQNPIDKCKLGFLSGNKSLNLYNRCVASEQLILSKYKMEKKQRIKIKRFFRTLKKHSLSRNGV